MVGSWSQPRNVLTKRQFGFLRVYRLSILPASNLVLRAHTEEIAVPLNEAITFETVDWGLYIPGSWPRGPESFTFLDDVTLDGSSAVVIRVIPGYRDVIHIIVGDVDVLWWEWWIWKKPITIRWLI